MKIKEKRKIERWYLKNEIYAQRNSKFISEIQKQKNSDLT